MSDILAETNETRRAHDRAPAERRPGEIARGDRGRRSGGTAAPVALDRMAAVGSILPQLGELQGFEWGMPIHHWPRETMVRFLLEALALVSAAIAAPAAGDDPAAAVTARIREAVADAYLAYEFSPSSYTRGTLRACLAAEQAQTGRRAAAGADIFGSST